MAFWRFGLANESAIDTLLKDWQAPSRQASIDSSNATTTTTASGTENDAAQTVSPTLEQLLEEDDLLQETKSGHTKLLEYLSSPQAIRRMLAYISGEAFEEDKPVPEIQPSNVDGQQEIQEEDVPPPVPAKDDKLPSINATRAAAPKATTFAEQVAAMPKQTPEEQELARKRLKYPYLCMEILSLDPPQVTDEIFRDTDAYIVPFWNYILDKGQNTSAEQALQVGHWAKVNIQWLSGSRVTQMVNFLRALPNLFDRMLVHLPSLSPISDILTKLVNMDDSHPHLGIIAWLHQQKLVPKVLELLDPISQPIDAHTPAGEFLRGIVAAASSASANKQQQQQQQQAAPSNGNDAWTTWPDNTLVRELASEATIKRLLHYMLDARPIQYQQLSDTKLEDANLETDIDDVPPTPTALKHDQDPTPTILQPQPELPSSSPPETQTPTHISPPPKTASAEAATSSLLNSLSLIIDIIRKNNSDFTELQILQYLERTHGEDDEDDEHRGGEGEGEDISQTAGQGPSLVDLSPLLINLTKRLPDLHQLLLNPRSQTTPIKTTLQSSTSTSQEPLTFERFRLCELYAELLHCSNMAILNRPPASPPSSNHKEVPSPSYDAVTGRILGSRREAYEQLSKALNAHPAPEEENDSSVIGNVGSQAGSGHGHGDEALVDPNLLHDELYIDGRPVTAVSDATSSYTSGASDGGPEQEDSEDVLEFLHSTIDDLSLEDDSQALSSNNSPRPPSYPNSPNPNNPLPTSNLANPSSPIINSPKPTSNGRADRPPPLDAFKFQSSKLPKIVEKPMLPGEALKGAFVKLNVPIAVLDLFFRFPWNNFLHNVVYDLVQQIFNGKLDPGPSRDLCLSIFCEGEGLVNRVLSTVEENKRITSIPPGIRLGHMGHVTLISEEIVKLFYNSPKDILSHIPSSMFSRDKWETYVEGLLRETRERDLQPLGGGISIAMHASVSAGSAGNPGIGIAEMDDEFPGPGKNFFATDDGEGSPNSSPDKAHFARYLAAQISSDYPGQSGHNPLNNSTSSSSSSGSSSSDDVPDHRGNSSQAARGLQNAASNWFSGDREGDSAFDDDDDEEDDVPGVYSKSHQDYDLGIGPSTSGPKPHVARQEKFGFDDAFDPSKFGTGDSDDDEDEDGRRLDVEDEDDDGFDPFADTYAARPSPQAVSSNKNVFSFDDDFGSTSLSSLAKAKVGTVHQQKLTPADWNASFRSSYDNKPSSSSGVNFQPSFGEFGDFSSAQDDESPNGNFEDDDDFGDFAEAGDVDVSQGDYDFTQTEAAPAFPSSPQRPAPPPTRQSFSNPISPPRKQAPALPGTPGEEVVGPGVHEGAHISRDGMHVEAEIQVNGETVTVQVPKDELTLHPESLQE